MAHVAFRGVAVLAFMPIVTVQAQPILYVDQYAIGVDDGSDWHNAHNHLQDALAQAAAAGSGVTEIRVAQGVYKPDQGRDQTPGDRGASFHVGNEVVLRGGYAGFGEPDPDDRDVSAYQTILSGDLHGNDREDLLITMSENSCTVVSAGRGVVDGFTITAGNDNPRCVGNGGGMACSSTTVVNCTFYRNRSTHAGGGMAPGNATVIDCTFRENVADLGGAVYADWGAPTFTGCRFVKNRANSWGGAMALFTHASVENCEFVENSAVRAGGAIFTQAPGGRRVINSNFTGNTASDGGALYSDSSAENLTNCTFSGNATNGLGAMAGGIGVGPNATVTLTNCVLWGNVNAFGSGEEAQIRHDLHPLTSVVINHTCIEGWTGALGGVGNFGNDPLFVNPPYWDDPGTPGWPWDDVFHGGNTRLRRGSPCIDAGDNGAVPSAITTDLDGNLRFIEDSFTRDTGQGTPPLVDMGAYEFQPPPITPIKLDIRPGSCPNLVNVRARKLVPMAIVGTGAFDMAEIDIDSLVLTRADGVGGEVTPITKPWGLRPRIRDVATPFVGEPCDCHGLRHDNLDDLLLRFATGDLVKTLRLRTVPDGDSVLLTLHGSLHDGAAFRASDCIVNFDPNATSHGRRRRPG